MKQLKLTQIIAAPREQHNINLYGLDKNGQVWLHDFETAKWYPIPMDTIYPDQPQSALNSFLDKADAPQDIPDD